MSKEKVRRQQPLLFIAQPKLDLPKAEMQQAFRTTRDKKKEVKTDDVKPKPAGVSVEEVVVKEGVKKSKKGDFKDLSITEKTSYLLNLPSQIPRMKCEVITEENSFIGTISGIEEDVIQFKSIRRPFKREIKLSSVKDIKLLGF
ncbi:Spore coat protein CotO [Terribacillus halophilus]|uniref:Spore coat protein CotO n=1 Tax=Terribacillus halophilus TaxID=361279 RepID=A0A1G6PHY7_9BACI|nr:CotO family spore coat protein [Terribacillus halophilus]SDC79611.1 Spore coat protein CotO [Terribacillus halophilus]